MKWSRLKTNLPRRQWLKPWKTRLRMMALTKNGLDHDAALEKMADVLASHVALTMDGETPFDINAYARDLLQLAKD